MPSHSCPPTSIWRSNYYEVRQCIADDLALLADSPDDLAVLLGVVDAVASKYGLFVNAAHRDYGDWKTHDFAYI
eukprot:353596-Chlamydomonas_euryale.AAC.7